MGYVKFTADDYNKAAEDWSMVDISRAITTLKELSFNQVTAALAAGATGATTNEHVFVAPTKMKITGVKFITTVVNTGADNAPEVKLLAGANIVGVSGAIALGGAVGDVAALTLDADYVTVAAGTKLIFRIVNPTATITTPLTGKLQIEWHSVV